MSEPFIAEIRIFGANFAPRGWAECDGQLLQISQFTAVFALVGTTFGGDGRTSFALPDLRGRVPIHPGSGPGLSTYRWGERGGVETTLLTEANMPSHVHGTGTSDTPPTTAPDKRDSPAGSVLGNLSSAGTLVYGSVGGASMANNTAGFTGGNEAHSNIMPYTCVNFIIALQGIFPSRS